MARPQFSFEEIRRLLKQRFPMLMIDTVVALEPGTAIRATKNVTGNELQLLGHFPDEAIMPGTLIVESIGQAASILLSQSNTAAAPADDSSIVLGTIHSMRFLAPVHPGDRLDLEVKVLKIVGDRAVVEGIATVDGVLVATGTLGLARRSRGSPGRETEPAKAAAST